jgi:proline iminopeptidase
MGMTVRRVALRAIFTLLALVGTGALALVIYLLRPVSTAPFRDQAGRGLPQSIASMERWPINGVDQSVILRGRDRGSPLLVWVHGGPGASETGVVRHYNSALEDHFVVVLWDQRYAGRSLDPFGPKPSRQTIGDYVSDLDVLINDLQRRFACRKVVLVAHSWGTVPGLLYAERHPENLAAYVGIGQEADALESERRSYKFVLDQARARRDVPAIERLERIGPPPRTGGEVWTPRTLLEKYGGAFHGHGSVVFDTGHMRFDVPIFFLSGRTDHVVDAPLTFEYLQRISAPQKSFLWFEDSGHYPPFEEPQKFNAWMIESVLPIARSACATHEPMFHPAIG